jgi:hypothetical protein
MFVVMICAGEGKFAARNLRGLLSQLLSRPAIVS